MATSRGPSLAEPDKSERSIPLRALLIPLIVLLLAGAAIGGYFFGQSSRQSDAQVAQERTNAVNVAVRRAVNDAVAKKGAEDKEKRLRIMARAEKKIKDRNKVVVRRVVRNLKKSGDRKAQQSFSSGTQSGFSSGKEQGVEEGVEEGLERGSDELTCSDDLDVPLPSCDFGE